MSEESPSVVLNIESIVGSLPQGWEAVIKALGSLVKEGDDSYNTKLACGIFWQCLLVQSKALEAQRTQLEWFFERIKAIDPKALPPREMRTEVEFARDSLKYYIDKLNSLFG